ncbi:hypothetical protein [Pseudactinotalea sp. Z1748]|uniref:hypothetical protein n=1 Tax=Pseudactinotalea sp. Z1748 TaxID=3413027 RepID=UPI003C7973B3
MSTISREEIVLAAVNSAGPVGEDESPDEYQGRIATQAKSIYLMLGERSPVRRKLDALADAKVFTGVVTKVVREKSSTRGKITLKTQPSKHYPDGLEPVRTERTDGADGEGLALAKRLSGLKGHRVLVWVEMQETSDGNQVRIVQHVEDLGEARESAAA